VPWSQFFILQELDAQLDHLREELQLGSMVNDARAPHLDSAIERCRRDTEALEERIRVREEQRAEAAAQLSAEPLRYYERLRRHLKVRPWVVAFAGSSCPACNVVLPSRVISDATRTRDPVACPSCRRLLVSRSASAKTG
jgi:predicted  nucleic acid-binding Zn-ribbon protein